jgi:hypothetical protein
LLVDKFSLLSLLCSYSFLVSYRIFILRRLLLPWIYSCCFILGKNTSARIQLINSNKIFKIVTILVFSMAVVVFCFPFPFPWFLLHSYSHSLFCQICQARCFCLSYALLFIFEFLNIF